MTQFTNLKNDELQEINGGTRIVGVSGGLKAAAKYAKDVLSRKHYENKPDYRTLYKK